MSRAWQNYMNLLTNLQPIRNKVIYTLNLCYIKNVICKQLQVIIIDHSENKKYITVQSVDNEQFSLVKNENGYYSYLRHIGNDLELDKLANKYIKYEVKNKIPRAVNIHNNNEIKQSIQLLQFSYFAEL